MGMEIQSLRMNLRSCFSVLLSGILLSIVLTSCTPAQRESISLGSFTENYVDVTIDLEETAEGSYVLSATFTPPDGYHLYSKDIPLSGVDGLGRPTLLELSPRSLMKATGALIESVEAQTPDFGPQELLVYPLGTVTLRLPIELPPGKDWTEDEIKVTYMACSASQCKPPVVGKIVSVRIPDADTLDRQQ